MKVLRARGEIYTCSRKPCFPCFAVWGKSAESRLHQLHSLQIGRFLGLSAGSIFGLVGSGEGGLVFAPMTQLAELTDEQRAKVKLVESVASVLGEDAPEGFGSLTIQQRKFASAYVLLDGNATKAAQVADYKNPSIMGQRATMHPKISELIRILSLASASATLPVAIATLAELAADPKVDSRTRRNCALDLAKIAGAMPKGTPQTAIQVNNGSSPDGTPANTAPSVVIQNVWDSRDKRLSSIAAPMPDTLDGENSSALIEAAPLDPKGGEGGVPPQGPVADS